MLAVLRVTKAKKISLADAVFHCVLASSWVGILSCGKVVLLSIDWRLYGRCFVDSFCYHNGMSFTLRVGCEFNPPPRSSLLLLLSLHLGHRIQLKIPLADAHTLKWEFPTLKPIRNQFQLSKKKSNKAVEICYRNIEQSKIIT